MAAPRKEKTGPPVQEDEAYTHLHDDDLKPLLDALARLSRRPPQTLLLEGGTAAQRMDLARYWAALANCEEIIANGARVAPCLACNACLQIGASEFLDLSIHDGRISNTEDEENPGPIKALNMNRVRELKSLISQPPHGEGKRVVILMGLPVNRDNAANALLKALEEPNRDTLFVLLAPQRQQLLPTLVSRSFVLTLPWPDPHQARRMPYEDELTEFFATGQKFLDHISLRGSIDNAIAEQIILGCQKSLLRVLAGNTEGQMEKVFSRASDPKIAANIIRWFSEAQEMLQYTVNPARVLEGLFTRLFCCLH